MMTVNKLIQFDEYTGNIPLPRLVLMTRSFEIIHTIPHFTNWRASIRGNELDEISFEVTKYVNGVLNPVWDDLIDLKIVSVECGKSVDNTGHECGKFEITVSYADENKTTKIVTGVSLETELGQLMLHDFHVNDEFYYEGQEQEGLIEYIPTVLYIHNATEEQKKYSLLHRVLADKAPHWKISEQEDRVAKMAYVVPEDKGVPEASSDFNRKYTVDGTSIYDFLTGDVAKDANIVFRFDTDKRELWFESLVDYVPEVGSSEPTVDGVGEDTTILVSKAKLGNSINIESNKDNVKNCFRVEGGDDLMTSQVAVVNLTGTNYIYHFADFQLADMPETLQQAISGYNAELADPSTQDEYYGENGLYTQYTEANAQYYYLRDEMAPSIHVDPPATPYDQWLELKQKLEDPDMEIGVYMTNSYDSEHYAGITNNVTAMLEVWCDSRYTVEVLKSPAPSYDATNLIWTGYVRVTDYKDTTQHYPFDSEISSHPFIAKITQDSDDDLTFTRQKLEIALAKGDMYSVDEQVSDSMTEEEIIEYFSEWNLTKLQSFQTGYDTCKSVLMSGTVLKNGTTVERTIAEDLMAEYDRRLRCVATVIAIREAELKDQQDILDRLIGYSSTDSNGNTIYTKGKIQEFQEEHSFYSYLVREYPSEADSLYSKFHAYIREDTYQNSNYTSESLETQKDLTDKAKELLEQADREIKKACVLQRTMTVSMNNLMAIPEFKVLQKKFEMFNYIRVRTEDEVLKLRLIGVDYSGDSMETVEVTFSDQIESVDGTISDLQSILNQAQAIATTYTAVSGQASKGSSAKDYILDTYRYGLDAANVMLKNSDNNEVTITSAGIIAKRMDDQGFYGDKQLRIIGNGMYMTEDAWNTVSMAVGEIQFANPITHQTSWKYGVIADAIVGKILVGQNLYIGNDSGSVQIDGNGIVITNGTITWGDGTNSVNSPTISDIPDLSTTLETITEEIEQLDGRIQTYCQPSTDDPSDDWTTTTEKDEHIGDIWYVTDEEVTKTYTKNGNVYSWQEIHDAVLETIASQRATIFTSIPNTALADGYCYKVNDLWYLDVAGDGTNNYPEYPADTVLVATQSATVYSKTHWVKKDRYTDDAALTNFITNTYTPDKQSIQQQIDGKIETYYQAAKPHNEYMAIDDNVDYDKWLGDLWYDTTNDKSFIYFKETNGTKFNYVWKESDGVPDIVYDQIDGKNTIFVTKPNTTLADGYKYHANDMWVLDVKGTSSNDYPAYDVGTLLIATTDATTYNKSHWVKKDRYTDDTALTTFIEGDYADALVAIDASIDKKARSWYQATDPSLTWDTSEDHEGDLWYNTTATSQVTSIYKNGSWQATNVPKAVFDEIDGKNTIYVTYPVSPDVPETGDLLIPNADITQSGVTYKQKKVYRYDGSAFVEIAYTDDSALTTFIDGAYATFKSDIQFQVDGKSETWYQANDPASSWSATDKPKHVGDLWYETGTQKTYVYEQGGTYQASGGYGWSFMNVPEAVFDEIDGKSTIYITWPSNPESGDLLIPSANITQSGTTYYKDKVYRYENNAFVEVGYTNDDALTEFLGGQYVTDMTNIGTELDKRAETWYLTESAMNTETATWNTTTIKDKHIGDIWYCTGINSGTTNYIVGHTYMYGKSGSTYGWNEVDGVPKTVFDTIDGKRSIFLSKPDTVRDDGYYYRQGDIWVLSSATTLDGVTYPAQTILYASVDNTTGFVSTQWGPTTTKSAEDALDQISTLDTDYSAFKTQVNSSLNTTVVGQDYIISPKIGGGYLYITNGGTSSSNLAYLEIDPHANRTNNGYIIRANYHGTDIFKIDSSGQAFFSGAITVGSTPSSSTTGFTVSSSGLLQASNATIYGTIQANDGTIGGWTINGTTGLKYQNPNDVNDFILLNSTNKSLISQTGNQKTALTSGKLEFYYAGTHYSTFMPSNWVGTNKRGTAVNSEAAAEFIAFGHKNSSTGNYDSNLVLNYGVDPDGYTEKIVLYGTVRTTDKIYVNGSDYINGSGTTYNGLYISSALKCDRIYAGNYIHGDYALDVNGTSYFSSYMYIGSTSYYLSSWSISGTLVGMGTNGTFAAATGLRVGSTAWTSYTASVHGSFYATNIRADAWGTGRYNSSYNHSLYGSLAVLDNSGNRATITANLSGNVTGNCSGSSGSCTGNAATATTASSCSGNSATATLSRRVQHTDSSIYVYMSTNDNFVPSASTVSCGTSAAPFSNFVKSSDRRIKKNITYLKEQMTPLEEMYFDLLPATYKFTTIEDGKTHMGFISQDVEAAMKKHGISSIIGDIGFGALGKDLKEDSVNKYTEEEIKADSIKEEDLSYALCYDEFIALNTHMIQKLYKRVEELETELSELKKQK